MKTKLLLFAGLLTLGLMACNKEEKLSSDDTQNQEPVEGAYMQIQVVGPTSVLATKTAPGEQDTEEGTEAENAFSNIRIILKPTGDNTASAQSFLVKGSDLSQISVDAGETYTGYATPRIKVAAAGTYEVFVIANDKSSSVWGTIADAPSSVVMTDVSQTAMQGDYASVNATASASKFMMFNESNGSDDIAGEPITIGEENTYDNPARCSDVIRLDRLAVKISPTVNGALTDLAIESTDGSGDALDAINTRFPSSHAEPAVKPAIGLTKTGVIGVLATAGTLKAEKYRNTRELVHGPVKVVEHVGQGFVELVEKGELSGRNAETVVEASLRPLLDAGADVIVLGCTHYPVLLDTIRKIAGPGIAVIDPAPAVAKHLADVMKEDGLPDGCQEKGRVELLSSGPDDNLKAAYAMFMTA